MSLERLAAAIGPHRINETLAIAAAWSAQADPLPPLALTVLSAWDGGQVREAEMRRLSNMLYKRVSKRTTMDKEDAARALIWWLQPGCIPCQGLGQMKIPDTVNLEDKPCLECSGSGLKPHPSASKGYAQSLVLLDSSWAWARNVSGLIERAAAARVFTVGA